MSEALDALNTAMEAYRRRNPRKADELDEAMARGVVDEDSEAAPVPAAGEHDPDVVASEHYYDQPPLLAPTPEERIWIARAVTEHEIEEAKLRMAQVNEAAGFGDDDPGGRHWKPSRDWLWVGFLVENEVEAWLLRSRVQYVRHGGVDWRPDFEVRGLGLGVKSASMAGAATAREFDGGTGKALAFLWPKVQRVPDYALFSYFDPVLRTVYLCGVASREDVVSSPVVLEGDHAYARVTADTDFYRVPETALRGANAWLHR